MLAKETSLREAAEARDKVVRDGINQACEAQRQVEVAAKSVNMLSSVS